VYDAGRGLIITNHHVIAAGTDHRVRVGDEERSARIVATSPCDDLALLAVDDTAGLVSLPIGDQSELRLGDTVVAIGYPGSLAEESTLTATVGVVSVVSTRLVSDLLFDVPRLENVIRTDTAINPGNSGGPLLSEGGAVVGVNSAGSNSTQNENYAIGIDRVREVVADLERGVSSGWAGVSFEFAQNDEGSVFLLTSSATPGSPAARAGLGRSALLVESIDEVAMDGRIATYCDVVGGRRAGESAEFRLVDTDTGEAAMLTIDFL
jgi:S1-C subfamily serine protease